MPLEGATTYLRGCGELPFEVQIGGFGPRDYPFISRNQTPYERSFSVQDDKVVLMGWPIRGKPLAMPPTTPATWAQESRLYPLTLDRIRHAAQGFGLLHDYHGALTAVDNDLFFRIGMVEPQALTPATASLLQDQVRQFLGGQPPLVTEIRAADICIAAYEDDRLPRSSTEAWSLEEPKVTGAFIRKLFQ